MVIFSDPTSIAGATWNRVRYSIYAPIYDLAAAPFHEGRRRSIELLDLQPGERVLLVGCGTGLDVPLLPRNVHVTAFDLTPAMVRRTAARAAALGRVVDAAVMNGQLAALANGVFDAVLLNLVLAVVPDPVACAREVARLLHRGGRAAIFDKWLPEGKEASNGRRALDVVASVAFSAINRHLEPILESADLTLAHRESVGPLGSYDVALVHQSV